MKATDKEESVWEDAVPIIINKNTITMYMSDGIGEPAFYNEMHHVLKTATEGDEVVIYINTPGGLIDSAVMIIDAIRTSAAFVTAELTGMVASAGTMIALACDKINVAPHTSFMIHNYSGGAQGKGHELKARQEFADKSLELAFRDFYDGFLTDDEIQEIIDGKDLWLHKEEVEERLTTREAKRLNLDNKEVSSEA